MNKKKKKAKGPSLAARFEAKKLKKASKLGKNLYKCIAAAHHPDACGTEWSASIFQGHPEGCPKCDNKYFRWINYNAAIA